MPRRVGRTRLTVRGWAVLCAGGALAAGGAWLGYVDLVRLGAFAVSLVVLSTAWAAWPLPALEVERQPAVALVPVGQHTPVRLVVRNPSRRRITGLTAKEEASNDAVVTPPPARHERPTQAPAWPLPELAPGEQIAIDYVVRPRRRGRHTLGPLLLTRGDPFGLAVHRTTAGDSHPVVAVPSLDDLDAPNIDSPGLQAQAERNQRRRIAAVAGTDATLRDYRYGDDLRRVHWPASAHRGSLVVRDVDDDVPDDDVAVILDPATCSSAGGLDHAVAALASVVQHLVDHNRPVATFTPQSCAGATDTRGLDGIRALAITEPFSLTSASTSAFDTSSVAACACDGAPGASLWVSAVGCDPSSARPLFASRPENVPGVAFIVADLNDEAAGRAAALGASFGWATTVVTPGPGQVTRAWQRLVDPAAAP